MFLKAAVLFFLLLPALASAQNMWGAGVYGGMQSCSTPMQAGAGATNINDETQEIMNEIAEAQKQLREKKSEKRKQDRELERAHEQVANAISDSYEDFIFEHMENARRCEEYQGFAGTTPTADGNITPIQSFSSEEWNQVCDSSKPGGVNSVICGAPKFIEIGGESNSCKKGLIEYRKQYTAVQKLQNEIESLEASIERDKDALADAKQDAAEDLKAATEAGVCIECMAQSNNSQISQPQTDWSSVIANIGTGLFASYMGYQQNKMISENNANLGWPTQSYPATSYGYPYLQAGIYGAVSGGTGQGTFACTNGMNGTGNANGAMGMMGAYGMGSPYGSNGGAFGYPTGMMGNMMGGGMYNSGMGPWGTNGMTGNPMMSGMGMMSGYGNSYGGGYGYGSNYGSGYGNGYGVGSGYGAGYGNGYNSGYGSGYGSAYNSNYEITLLMSRIQMLQYGGTNNYLGYGTLGTTSSYNYGSMLTPITTGTLTPLTNTSSGR